MKWKHWSVLIVLILLNYLIFSVAFTLLAEQRQPSPLVYLRTPKPTFTRIETGPIAWRVLPTCTPCPTRTPLPPTPTTIPTEENPIPVDLITPTPLPVIYGEPSPTAISPTATPSPSLTESLVHTIQRGETLSEIARMYGVSIQSLVTANGLTNPNHIIPGQKLTIPGSGGAVPTATASHPATHTPTPKPKPPKPTATATPSKSQFQFTGEVIWDPWVAPNCSGPSISKQSVIRDVHGNPLNGVRVEVNCYGNVWLSHPSGNPGEYEPGHYDFAFGQLAPQDWTCTARVFDINGQPVASSEVVTIHFDTNDCRPNGSGHQVAIVNWVKHW